MEHETRRGRPPLSPEAKRGARLTIRFTEAEREALERLSEREGLSPSALVHRIVTRSLQRRQTAGK